MNKNQPISLKIKDREGKVRYVLTAYAGKNDLIVTIMTTPSGTPYALSALQAGSGMPKIVKRGWQDKMIEWVKSGLYKNVEVES